MPHKLFAALLILASALSVALAQEETEPPPAPPIEALSVAGTIWMLRGNTSTGNPTTVVSIGEDGVFIADPNMLQVAEALRDKIEELGGGEIRYVTSTHHHGDHTEGYEAFTGEGVGIVPSNQRERLAADKIVDRQRPLAPESLPAKTYDERTTLTLNGETIELITLPEKSGHTDSDALVYFKNSGVLYVGDYLFLDRYPSIDFEAGGSLDGYIANVKWILETYPEDTVIIPGHGTFYPEQLRTVTMEHYASNVALLEKSISYIRGTLEAGLPIAQFRTAGLPDELAVFAQRPRYVDAARWIDTVAGGRKKKKSPPINAR